MMSSTYQTLKAHSQPSFQTAMKISDFLSAADVLIDVRAAHKRQLLRELAEKMAEKAKLSADEINLELLKREDLGSTGTGDGVAIPHARIKGLTKPLGFVARLKRPINFDAIDGQRVDTVFVLLLPSTTNGEQLGALASVARRLRTPEVVARIREASTEAEVYTLVAE
jgi:nitrogen PTS system EIIA component